ncbi:hypothetical protein GF319_01520, partial [Candidatus Bathyarchaeota archaeon]|nr:hypothetical protein [Candidatus Bathyarchaeota archaeon]
MSRVYKRIWLVSFFLFFLTTRVFADLSHYIYTVKYTFENKGDETYFLSDDDLSIPLGLNDEWQRVEVVESSHPLISNMSDMDGNSIAIVETNRELLPEENLSFRVTYSINSRTRERPDLNQFQGETIPNSLVEEYCLSTNTFQSGEGEIVELAKTLVENNNNTLDKILPLTNWVITNITYGNYDNPRFAN